MVFFLLFILIKKTANRERAPRQDRERKKDGERKGAEATIR